MSAADKLAQVLAEHYEWHYAAGSCKRIACYGCAEEVEVPDLTNLTDDDADAAATRTFRAHVAAVVLAHLTAEGWAQGKPEYAVSGAIMHPVLSYDHGAATTLHTKHGMPVVRRYVTDWEPVEGEEANDE